MSTLVKNKWTGEKILFTKGAVENVLKNSN